MSAPEAPAVLAAPGEVRCGERFDREHVTCDRPFGHAGAHLSETRGVYWQAAS